MIEEQLRRGGVLAEDGDARVRRQMELRAADRNRLAQARGQPRHALADRFAIRTLEHQREQALAQLPEVPPGLTVPLVRFGRQTQDRRAHDLLGDLGGDDLRDVADAVELDDGDRERPLAQRRHRHRLLATSEEAAAVELGTGDRKSTRLNSSHGYISYAVFCLKKKTREPAARSNPHPAA